MTIVRLAITLTVINMGLLLVGLTQAGPAGAQGAPAVLRGRALELVDERGQLRARLNIESDGQVVLRLLDQKGTIRVKLGADKDGSGLLLANDATEPGVHILAKAEGSSLKLRNKDGRERTVRP
ncbi:MAG TPA: hypothetical protein VFS51_09965 [Gemmatimonadales bacterium]|nr:hypothetical protein [Gemmatimonadales bacterium]